MIRHPIRNAALALIAATLSFGASCVSDDGGTYDRNTGSSYDPYYDNDRSGRDSDRPNRIPRYADLVREESGKIRWTADLDGTFYVYDRDKDFVCYTGPIRRGMEVIVMPRDDRVVVNERVVSTENLERNNVHRIYFAANRPNSDRRDRDDRDGTRNDRPANGLPDGARRVARGSGAIDFDRIPGSGTLIVYDEDDRRVMYRTDVRRGTAVRVVPGENKVYVDGQVTARPRFERGHTLGLYFVGR